MKTDLLNRCYDKFTTPQTQETVRLNVSISNRILDILEERGMSQKEFAKLMGKTEAEVSRWLSGTHNLTTTTIASINVALGENVLDIPKRKAFPVFITIPTAPSASSITANRSRSSQTYSYNQNYEC